MRDDEHTRKYENVSKLDYYCYYYCIGLPWSFMKRASLKFFITFQPDSLEDVTVDPIEDDIEITNEETTSEAFAVSIF